jgi:CheY-like chemotaxis protein
MKSISNLVSAVQKRKQHTKKMLVVEDDPDLLYILEEVFKEEGYKYVMCKEVVDILPLAREHQPDLILLDYILPNINGGELCSQLKSEGYTSDYLFSSAFSSPFSGRLWL